MKPTAKLKVSIVGGSGYTGGELLRILLFHPHVEVSRITSEQQVGKFIHRVHPNLRKQTALKFSSVEELEPCDLLFLCLPHGEAMHRISRFQALAPRIIDLSSDFRLSNAEDYPRWYGAQHPNPELLKEFVYGIPELHREEMKQAAYVSGAGCNATAVILALYPLFHEGLTEPGNTVVEVKAGTSQAGNRINPGSHHPERSRAIRAYKPTGHRHTAEMLQELGFGRDIRIHFTATSIDMVRGIHCVAHVFLNRDMDEKAVRKLYRETYGDEPFIRMVNDRDGIHRLPDPKILAGTNFCDIGFALDPHSRRLVVYSALDNLVKGAAGQAVQALNLMHRWDETTGLTFPGLHPV
jgi:N-acetyl-gamma-glutamyl-phosphate/LysW-gamma-L-alpha-aminoadipyl-6-phosphate reductase